MPPEYAWGLFTTLLGAMIIGVVSLAFKKPSAYSKLLPILISIDAIFIACYFAYWIGFADGASWGREMTAVVQAEEMKVPFTGWPVILGGLIFAGLMILEGLAYHLGFSDEKKADR
jgi:hypothetical protein